MRRGIAVLLILAAAVAAPILGLIVLRSRSSGVLMRVGVPELLVLAIVLIGPIVAMVVLFNLISGRRAKRFGYGSRMAYLRGIPRSDDERRDAADLTMKGLALCMLGLLFPPAVLIGIMPLFYGGRKLAYASMGLGLVDDGDRPRA